MTTKMKKAIKLIKYGFDIKINFAFAIIFLLFGIVFIGVSSLNPVANCDNFILGAFYVVLVPMFVIQVQLSTLYANMVKSSPLSRIVEVELADFLCGVFNLVIYTLIFLYTVIMDAVAGISYPPVYLLILGIVIMTLQLYFSLAYKYFVASVIGLIIVCLPFISSIETVIALNSHININRITSFFLGYIPIITGMALAALIRRFLYKHPLSLLAAGQKLRKQI